MEISPLNLFYEEPDPDRWFTFDRYPRKIIRRIIRGKPRPGGVKTIAINLKKGLDLIGIPYRFNDYRHLKKHPQEIACIIGKPQLLFEKQWKNPVIFGAGVYSHPVDCPDLFEKYPHVKRFLVPGNWMLEMCRPYYGNRVLAWPAGIDTSYWSPSLNANPHYDFMIYNKIHNAGRAQQDLLHMLIQTLEEHQLSYQMINYGHYTLAEMKQKLSDSKAAIFLCEHETQGIAYQQILSTNTPVLALDNGGYWKDPAYFPHKVKYQPVSSVPYWDERCGLKFTGIADFNLKLAEFKSKRVHFKPRAYILENLTLEKSAHMYCAIVQQVYKELLPFN